MFVACGEKLDEQVLEKRKVVPSLLVAAAHLNVYLPPNLQMNLFWSLFAFLWVTAEAFVPSPYSGRARRSSVSLFASSETKAAPIVSGEELEKLLTDLDQPLVVDAYATWW